MTEPSRARRSLVTAVLAAIAVLAPLAVGGPTYGDELLDESSEALTAYAAPLEHEREGGGRRTAVLEAEDTDCFEVIVNRAAKYADLRQRVPERYGLVGAGTAFGRIFFVNVQCDVSLEGHPARRTTSVYVLAALTSRDGLTSTGHLLAHGVNNPELAARYRAAGLPTHWQPDTTATETVDDAADLTTMQCTVVGDGMDYALTGAAKHPLNTPVVDSESDHNYDGPRGDLLLSFENTVRSGAPPRPMQPRCSRISGPRPSSHR